MKRQEKALRRFAEMSAEKRKQPFFLLLSSYLPPFTQVKSTYIMLIESAFLGSPLNP